MANQTAVGLKKAELIERLTAENIVKDMFDALAAGSVRGRRGQGARGGLRPQPAARVPARRARAVARGRAAGWPELAARVRDAAAAAVPASVLRLPPRLACGRWRRCRRTARRPWSGCGRACDDARREEGLVVGLSDVDRGAASARRRMREAADAARIGRSLVADGGAVSYEQLGAYRYLVHLELDDAPHDRYRQLGRGADRVRPHAAARGWSRRSSASWRTAAASPPARAPSTSTRTPSASGSSGSSGSPSSTSASEDLLSLELALKLARLAPSAGGDAASVPATAREPDPDRPNRHVEQEHEQEPPGLDQELQVRPRSRARAGQVERRSASATTRIGGTCCVITNRIMRRPPYSRSSRMTIRAKLYAAIVLTILGPLATTAVALHGMDADGRPLRRGAGAGATSALALELKFAVTDMNGWQTAYGYDDGASRPRLRALGRDAPATTSARRRKQLDRPARGASCSTSSEREFAGFMELDAVGLPRPLSGARAARASGSSSGPRSRASARWRDAPTSSPRYEAQQRDGHRERLRRRARRRPQAA